MPTGSCTRIRRLAGRIAYDVRYELLSGDQLTPHRGVPARTRARLAGRCSALRSARPRSRRRLGCDQVVQAAAGTQVVSRRPGPVVLEAGPVNASLTSQRARAPGGGGPVARSGLRQAAGKCIPPFVFICLPAFVLANLLYDAMFHDQPGRSRTGTSTCSGTPGTPCCTATPPIRRPALPCSHTRTRSSIPRRRRSRWFRSRRSRSRRRPSCSRCCDRLDSRRPEDRRRPGLPLLRHRPPLGAVRRARRGRRGHPAARARRGSPLALPEPHARSGLGGRGPRDAQALPLAVPALARLHATAQGGADLACPDRGRDALPPGPSLGFASFRDYPNILNILTRLLEGKGYSLVSLGLSLGAGTTVSRALPWIVGGAALALIGLRGRERGADRLDIHRRDRRSVRALTDRVAALLRAALHPDRASSGRGCRGSGPSRSCSGCAAGRASTAPSGRRCTGITTLRSHPESGRRRSSSTACWSREP